MATKLYFHVATNPNANLPTTEQSAWTSVYSLNPVSTNFLMDTAIGAAQVTRPTSGTSSAVGQTFIGRWVSETLGGTTQIDANTWTLNFAATDAGSNKFPVTGTNAAMRVCAYVWRPGTGKVGSNIIDGSTGANFQVGTTTEKVEHGTFSGALVTGVQSTDVICIELWSDTSAAGSGWAYRIYFDGTTENTTPAATVSNHAAFVETPQNITFPLHKFGVPAAETTTVSDAAPAVLRAKNRPITETVSSTDNLRGYYLRPLGIVAVTDSIATDITHAAQGNNVVKTLTETITVTAGTLARLSAKKRALATQTITISEISLTRLLTKIRALSTQSTAISETLARLTAKKKALATETITGSESTARLSAKKRALATETVSKGESIARLRPLARSLTESITITAGTLARLSTKIRALALETVSKSESIVRLLSKRRTLTDTLPTTDTTARLKTTQKAIPGQSVSISDSLNRLKESVKVLSDTLISNESIATRLTKIRTVVESYNITDVVSRSTAISQQIFKTLTETVAIAENLARLSAKNRILALETISKSETIARIVSKVRTLSDNVNKGETIARQISKQRTATESNSIIETLAKLVAKKRVLIENIAATETLARLSAKVKTLTDTIAKGETVTGIAIRGGTLVEFVNIIENLARRTAKQRVTATETVATSAALSRIKVTTKALATETVNKGESIAKSLAKTRPITDIVTISTQIARLLAKTRVVATQTVTIADSVSSFMSTLAQIVRIIEEADIIVSDAFHKTRVIVEDAIFTEDFVDYAVGVSRHEAEIIETVEVSDFTTQATEIREVVLSLTETVSAGEAIGNMSGKIRRIGGLE